MKTVPSHFVDLAFPGINAELRTLALNSGVLLGKRIEIDLEDLATTDVLLAKALNDYDAKVRNFWDSYSTTGVGGNCYITLRTLETFIKVDNKENKIYLKDQIKELESFYLKGDALKEILGGVYNPEKLDANDIMHEKEGNIIYLKFEIDGKYAWSQNLGGVGSRGEIGRSFELKISHAKSHDRKNQRLLEVKVKTKEIWPK